MKYPRCPRACCQPYGFPRYKTTRHLCVPVGPASEALACVVDWGSWGSVRYPGMSRYASGICPRGCGISRCLPEKLLVLLVLVGISSGFPKSTGDCAMHSAHFVEALGYILQAAEYVHKNRDASQSSGMSPRSTKKYPQVGIYPGVVGVVQLLRHSLCLFSRVNAKALP